MANIFWRNLLGDNDANNINNYATTESGTTVPGGALSDYDIAFSKTASSAMWRLSANLDLTGRYLYCRTAESGGTDNFSGNGTTTGNIKINGYTLTIAGLKIDGTNNTDDKCYLQMTTASSVIIYSGDFIAYSDKTYLEFNSGNSIIRYTGTSGSFQLLANAIASTTSAKPLFENNGTNLSWDIAHYSQRVHTYTDTTSGVLTISSSGQLSAIALVLSGVIGIGTNSLTIASTTITYNVDSDITGSGSIRYIGASAVTLTDNKISNFSFTGNIDHIGVAGSTRYIFPGHFGNAVMLITNTTGGDSTLMGSGSSCYYASLTTNISSGSTTNFSPDGSSFYISGNISLQSTGTLNYTAGSCVWNLIGSSGTQTINFNGKTIHDLVLNCSGAIKQITSDFNLADLTITAGTFDMQTYNCTADAVSVTGTHKMGVSSGAGLTCSSFTTNSGWVRDWQTGSKITCSGNFIQNDTGTYTAYRGNVTLSGNGNISLGNSDSYFYAFTQNVGVTTTVISVVCRLTALFSLSTTINGTFILGANELFIGASASGSVTFGASSDVTNTTGILSFVATYGVTFTNNRVTAFSVTLARSVLNSSADNYAFPAWDFSNADIQIHGRNGSTGNRYITDGVSGTLKCKSLTFIPNSTQTMIVINNNCSINCSGDIDFNSTSPTATVTYTKGTGIITLIGSSGTQTINFRSQTIDDLIINSSGAIKQLTANVTTDSLTITAGTFDIQTYNCTVSGAVSVTGTFQEGVSSGTGLTCAGLTINSGAQMYGQTGSKINNSGSYSCPDESIFTSNNRFTYTQTDSANISNPNVNNIFNSFTLNVTKNLTFTGNTWLVGSTGTTCDINGTIIAGAYNCYLGGTITIASTGDITGSNGVYLYTNTSSQTFSRASALSFTGNIYQMFGAASPTIREALVGDFSNADYNIKNHPSIVASSTLKMSSGTLKAKSFKINQALNYDLTLDCATNNTSFNISGDIDFKDDSSTYSLTISKGTGIYTLSGSSGTHSLDFQGKTIEDIVVNCSGAIKQLVNNVVPDSLTITAGTFDIQTYNCTCTGGVDLTGNITMGISADTGLTCNGFVVNLGGTMTLNKLSIIRNNGEYVSTEAQNVFTTESTGKYYALQSANYIFRDGPNYRNRWNYVSIPLGVTLTHSGNQQMNFTGNTAAGYDLYGIIDAGVGPMFLMCGEGGTINIGEFADIYANNASTGVYLNSPTSATINIHANKTSWPNIKGGVSHPFLGTDNTWIFQNTQIINYIIRNYSNNALTHRFLSGDYYFGNMNISITSSSTITFNNSNNPNINLSGDVFPIEFAKITGWTKGTGVITLTGSSGTQTINFNGKIVEDIVLNCSGAIKQIASNFSCDSLSGTGGTLQSNVSGTQREITVGASTSCTGISFKDIVVKGGFLINCKDKASVDAGSSNTNINLGNNSKSLVFNDKLD